MRVCEISDRIHRFDTISDFSVLVQLTSVNSYWYFEQYTACIVHGTRILHLQDGIPNSSLQTKLVSCMYVSTCLTVHRRLRSFIR